METGGKGSSFLPKPLPLSGEQRAVGGGKWEVYLLPSIKPPAAGRLPAMGAARTATAITSERREPHPRAEVRPPARRGLGPCLSGTLTGKPNTALLEPQNSGGFTPRCPARPGWLGVPGVAGTSLPSWWRKQGHFKSPMGLLSAAELQPALLMADARKPAV